MSEKSLKNQVLKMLSPFDAVCVVEHEAHSGTPDVNFIEGWIELKIAEGWPVKGGVLHLEHFTPQQRVWLTKRHRKGGNVWLLLRVGKEWLLFDGGTAAEIVGRATRHELLKSVTRHWPQKPTTMEFQNACVTNHQGRAVVSRKAT